MAERISSVCVYCGSRRGQREAFPQAAAELGRGLAERGIGLVYGGGSVGLMGVLADAALGAGGRVVGVIPRFLVAAEVAHAGVSELIVVNSMHERKLRLFELADAFLTLPGGFGTLDETFEMITWKQLGRHHKPILFVSIEDFFAPLLAHLEQARAQGLLGEAPAPLYEVVPSVGEALAWLERRAAGSRPGGVVSP
ncbi:MAG: hypothetical protein KatS3mg102_0178 [Planctomycetota bacterium]|nr:MAG: hypothetical protein KatS3mg102_0178 [Planctomycetota bacterium]